MTEPNTDTALTPISQAQRMLAEAKTLPELRNLRDYATGAKAWAKARGLGIEAENEATEVILRAERSIGQSIAALRSEGRYGVTSGQGKVDGQTVGVLLDAFPEGQATTIADLVERSGLTEKQVRNALKQSDLFVNVEPGAGVWGVNQREAERRRSMVTTADLGLSDGMAADFQRLAALDDDRFEAMVRSVRALPGARLAKANFYRAIEKADAVRAGAEDAKPTPSNHGFDMLRRGVYDLLGYEVDEEGVGSFTRNGLMLLPDDELRALAEYVKALAVAYGEVKAARAG